MKGTKGEKRKQELLNIAYQMFILKGYEETSIDEIIAQAQIAKGTYYYYFPSKEATLEAVIDMMINNEVRRAQEILSVPISVPQKLIGVITSLRPEQNENNIADALNKKENIVMHERVRMILISSDHLYDSGSFTAGVIEVFIDMVEKSLGAKPGTLGYIHELIRW